MLSSAGEPFTTGVSKYLDSHPAIQEPLARIYVKFRPEGVDANLSLVALLDTGGHYCILGQDAASLVQKRLTSPIGEVSLLTAYGLVRGALYTHRITLIAEVGASLDIETIVFLSPDWKSPVSFLGYTGVIDRMLFAVDSTECDFHFGPPR